MEFKRSNKTNINERNIEENRGWVINEMNKIESKINDIIIDYFQPKDKNEFKKIILNSSIISVGGKIKILKNIRNFENKEIDNIIKLNTIRNSFAHIPVLTYFDVEKIEKSEGEFKAKSIYDKIEVMSSSGLIEAKLVKVELEKFEVLKNEITKYIDEFSLD